MSKLFDFFKQNKSSIRFVLLFLGLFFVVFLLKQNWLIIQSLLKEMDIILFVISIFIGIFGTTVSAIYFKKLLEKHGTCLTNLLVIKMYMVGQIAKYIPGKVWGMAYQISHIAGFNAAKSIIIANMEMMLGIIILTGLLSLSLLVYLFFPYLSLIVFLTSALLFIVFYKTNFVDVLISLISRKYRELNSLEQVQNTNPSNDLIDAVFIYFLFSTAYIASNLFMLIAVFHFSVEQSLIYIVLLSISWLAGVFTIIIPAGVGVREIVFVAISSYVNPEVSLEILTSIAVISRFWQIIQEILGMIFAQGVQFITFRKQIN